MKRLIQHTALIIALVCPSAFRTGAQTRDSYATDLLAEIAAALGKEDSIASLPEGLSVAALKYGARPVTVVKEHGKVSHIGLTVFGEELRKQIPSPFYDAVERYALIDVLPMKRIKTVDRELFEEGVEFMSGNIRRLPSFYEKEGLEFQLRNENGRKYVASWRQDGHMLEEIVMPYTYGFLHGLDMDECESRLLSDLQDLPDERFNGFSPCKVDRSELVTYFPVNYYIKPGESYYFDHLNANRYYTSQDSTEFVPIYDPSFPHESLANVLTSLEVANDLRLDISLVTYNFKKRRVTVPLSQFIDYCLQRGCDPFFGIIESTEERTVCQLLLRNTDEGFCHLLKITAPSSLIGAREGTYEARMNSYIPISKITSLFPRTDAPQR